MGNSPRERLQQRGRGEFRREMLRSECTLRRREKLESSKTKTAEKKQFARHDGGSPLVVVALTIHVSRLGC